MKLAHLLAWTLDLVQLRAAPADAPPSQAMLGLLFVLDLIVSALYLQMLGREIAPEVLAGRAALHLGLVYLLLAFFGFQVRFVQTAIALVAAGVLLTLVTLPIVAGAVRSPGGGGDGILVLLQLGFLFLILWSVVVHAHILRHALALSFWFVLPMALLLFLVYHEVADRLFPLP